MKQNRNVRLQRLINKVPYVSNFMTILDFFISHRKNWPLSRGWQLRTLVAVAVVERFK